MNHNYAKLLEAMDFTPQMWEVVGVQEKNTAPKCSCGHDIIYNYPIKHKTTGKILPIGSVCIEHAPFIPIELANQYKSIVARLKTERRAAELVRQAAIKGELERRYKANCDVFLAVNKNRGDIGAKLFGNWWWSAEGNNDPRYAFNSECWKISESIYKLRKKKLKTAKGWIKNYTQVIDAMQVFNDKYKLAMILYGSKID